MCSIKAKEEVQKLEEVLIEICGIYQSVVIDIDATLTKIDSILSTCKDCERGQSISDVIVEMKSKYLPKLIEVRHLTESIIESAEVSLDDVEVDSIVH